MQKNPWTAQPFIKGQPIEMPLFDLKTGEFTGEIVSLDESNFNLPLRRDIVHNVNLYFNLKGKRTYKLVKRLGDVAGAGKKPANQKGRGAARQGNRRASTRVGGGKAHGAVPRDLSIDVNEKMRLLSFRTMLSAKLYENRVIFIETEELEYPKTQLLAQIVAPFQIDKLTFVVGSEPANNHFELASNGIKNVTMKGPQELNTPDLLNADYVIITKQGLIDLEEVITKRMKNLFRNRKTPNLSSQERQQAKRTDRYESEVVRPILDAEKIENYDDNLPLELQVETLKHYIDDLRKVQERSKTE